MIKKINYWKRITSAYLFNNSSQLSFWHEEPMINDYDKNEVSKIQFLQLSKQHNERQVRNELAAKEID